MTQPTIILISFHFHPSFEIGAKRVTALARFLSERGIRVLVVSEFGGHAFRQETEIWPGVIAVPVPQPKRLIVDALLAVTKKTVAVGAEAVQSSAVTTTAKFASPTRGRFKTRLRNAFFKMAYFIDPYKKWSWRASRASIKAGKKYNARLVISSGPPHTMLISGTLAARKLGIPHIADLRDPWTDLVMFNGAELSMLRRFESWVMNSAAAITSTGASVARILAERYPKVRSRVHVIRNGFDGDLQRVPSDTGHRLSILFAGELYVKRNPFPLFTALETLLGRPDVDASRINVTFMGRCATYNDQPLADWLKGKRCESVVKILPQMPAAAVAAAIQDSTVLLNLAQQQPLSVPAKTFEHIASGREILLICEDDSDTAEVVRGIQGVLQVDQANTEALEKTLSDLYQRHVVEGKLTTATEVQALQFSRQAVNEQFLAVMRSVAELN